jgi:hypothetical protein
LVIQAWQGLPDSDQNILHKIIDPVGVAFINGRNATHHSGMDLDYLLQLGRTAHIPTYNNSRWASCNLTNKHADIGFRDE